MHDLPSAAQVAQKVAYAQNQSLGVGIKVTQSPVDSAIDDLATGIKRAYDMIDSLGSRLSPVLTTIPGQDGATACIPSSCHLESRIIESARGVHELADRISALRQALCI